MCAVPRLVQELLPTVLEQGAFMVSMTSVTMPGQGLPLRASQKAGGIHTAHNPRISRAPAPHSSPLAVATSECGDPEGCIQAIAVSPA